MNEIPQHQILEIQNLRQELVQLAALPQLNPDQARRLPQVRSRLKSLACGCYNRTRRTTTVN